MTSWLNKLFGWLRSKPPRLICRKGIWHAGMRELAQRTLGQRRESGAFLLGREYGASKRILEFVFYDDIDRRALESGIVHFDGNQFPKLWQICRQRGYGVVADVHVHPAGYFQSPSDREDPVIPRAGHLAIIIPDYAARATSPGGIGLYEYLGNGVWLTHTHEAEAFFRLD